MNRTPSPGPSPLRCRGFRIGGRGRRGRGTRCPDFAHLALGRFLGALLRGWRFGAGIRFLFNNGQGSRSRGCNGSRDKGNSFYDRSFHSGFDDRSFHNGLLFVKCSFWPPRFPRGIHCTLQYIYSYARVIQSSNCIACGILTILSAESRTVNFRCRNCRELAQYNRGGWANPLWIRLPG